MKLKVGLIGCGGIGAVHAECWLSLSDKVQLVAIADSSTSKAKKYAEKSGAKIYEDAFEMLEKEITLSSRIAYRKETVPRR